jgi:predicted PhzF superfamily epimerase YddE/YHI9
MPRLHVLRVFCAEGGGGGNPLGVFLDGAAIDGARRQAVAHELGYSETVFVDDAERGEIRIFTPLTEVPFAGHPTVGAAWLLGRECGGVGQLRPPAGTVPVREEGGLTFAAGRAEWTPEWRFVELASPSVVDALAGPPDDHGATSAWSWIDRDAGVVRARVFAGDYGIAEDEATGSAALALSARVGRELDVRQGEGSRILARPLDGGMIEIGGRVEIDELREHPVAG